MKKYILIIIMISSVIGMLCAQNSVAMTLKVKGDVNLNRENKTTSVKTGELLNNKDELESKNDSYAAIKFTDGSSVVKLFPNSILRIKTEKKGGKLNKKSYLKVGNLWSKVMKNSGAFEVETPTTVVSVKGTNFLVRTDKFGTTTLFVLKGTVKMTNKKDGKSAMVKKGFTAISNGSSIEVRQTKPNEIDEEIMSIINEDASYFKFKIKNEAGEKRDVEIQFE